MALISGQVYNTLSFIDATRLLLVESGGMSNDDFDSIFADINQELKNDPNDGIEYIFVRWGYWWVVKDD